MAEVFDYLVIGAGSAGCVVAHRLAMAGRARICVLEASVMPTMPSANLNAATLMIAEKASDMILGRPPLPAAEL